MSDNHDQVEPQIAEPGNQLKQQREAAGLSLQDISNQTLISVFRLQALEGEDFDEIGGKAYLAGYTRAYAKVLGIDGEPYVRAFETLLEREEEKPDPLLVDSPPSGTIGVSRSRMWIVVIAFLCLLLVAGGLALLLGGIGERSTSVESDDPPAVNADTSSRPPFDDVVQSRSSVPSAPTETEFDAEVGAGEPSGVIEDNVPSSTSQLDVGVDDATRESQAGETDNTLEQQVNPEESVTLADLTLEFSDDCWVEVADASGTVLVARLAKRGDNLRLSGNPPFEINLGNARVVDVTLNGTGVDVPVRAGRNSARFTVGQRL